MKTLIHALCATALVVPATVDCQADDAFERGLTAIQPDAIRSDLYFLADDAMRGRDTPSPEQRIAARYLRARVQALGFEPGGEEGSWFDLYTLGVRKLDLDASELVLVADGDETRLEFGTDYFLAVSSDARAFDAEGGVVFVGDGEKGDFQSLPEGAVEGRWVLCRDTGRRAIQRRNRAMEHGAVGVLVTPGPKYDKEPYPERHGRVTETLTRGQVTSGPGGPSRAPRKAKPSIPQVYIAPELGDAWIGEHSIGDVLPFSMREKRVASSEAQLENVCALWRGSDPVLSNEVLIVSAHYDHVGQRGDAIYNGADDNGSGTSGLLAVAEALAAHGPLKRSVLLIWVSGEEKGLFGSQAWAMEPTLGEGMRPVANLNIDMIGRNGPEELGLTPSESHSHANFLSSVARELSPLEGFPTLESADKYYNRSDQASFAKLDIPVCFLFAGEHEDYHKPTDTADKIDYDKVARVSRLIYRMLTRLDDEGF